MKFRFNFLIFSVFFYSIIALIYILNYESFLLQRIILPLIFIILFLYRNKFTWFLLIILLISSVITYTLQCNYPIYNYLYEYMCRRRPLEAYIYLSKYIPLDVNTFFYKMIYLGYLFLALIILNFKKYKNMYGFREKGTIPTQHSQ